MDPSARKPVFGARDEVRLKLASSDTKDSLEKGRFYLSKFCYISSQKANNKIVDRTAQMRRLISAFVVRIQENQDFLASRRIQLLFTISGINISEKRLSFQYFD